MTGHDRAGPPPRSVPPMTSLPPTAAGSRFPIRMALAFDDASPVVHCLVTGCRWHGHGDSMADAVTGWTAHVAASHRNDWGDDL